MEFTQKSAGKSVGKAKSLVMAGLATKKAGAVPGLVSGLAGVAPPLVVTKYEVSIIRSKP